MLASMDPEHFTRHIDAKTKAVYIESISNPRYYVPDFAAFAKVAHDAGVPLIVWYAQSPASDSLLNIVSQVDNTFGCGGFLIQPIAYGADIVTYSAIKWICGHGTTIGRVVIDSGNFDWSKHSERFPLFIEPSPRYHGISFWKSFGKKAFAVWVRSEMLKDVGCALNPIAAFQLLQGLETLSLRVESYVLNALELARWLERSQRVTWVSYCGESCFSFSFCRTSADKLLS